MRLPALLSARPAALASLAGIAGLAGLAGVASGAVQTDAAAAPWLTVAFARHPDVVVMPVVVGSATRLTGRATDGRRGMPNVPVAVVGYPAGGGQQQVIGSAVTSASGRYSAQIVMPPASEIVYVAAGLVRSNSLTMRPTVAVGLSANHHAVHPGHRLTFTGHVSPAVPTGVFVLFEVKRGRRFQTFAARQISTTDSFGTRFTFRTPHERYEIRAEIPRQPLFPYTDSVSRVLHVSVR